MSASRRRLFKLMAQTAKPHSGRSTAFHRLQAEAIEGVPIHAAAVAAGRMWFSHWRVSR
jgi:hypothetical protein